MELDVSFPSIFPLIATQINTYTLVWRVRIYLIRAETSGWRGVGGGVLFCPAFPLSSPPSLSLFPLLHVLLAEPQSRDLNEDECEESICGIFLPSGWGSSLHLN